jgi:DNA-binding response OmpR family regulator
MRFALPMLKARDPRLVGACRMNLPAAPIRVLLVEPHADTRELYDVGLTAAGFEVVTVADMASAMIAFTMHRPTIVVSETRLPDGSDMLTNLARVGVPVIALTTEPLWERRAFRAAGLTAVLLKPCLPDEVATAIRGALAAR